MSHVKPGWFCEGMQKKSKTGGKHTEPGWSRALLSLQTLTRSARIRPAISTVEDSEKQSKRVLTRKNRSVLGSNIPRTFWREYESSEFRQQGPHQSTVDKLYCKLKYSGSSFGHVYDLYLCAHDLCMDMSDESHLLLRWDTSETASSNRPFEDACLQTLRHEIMKFGREWCNSWSLCLSLTATVVLQNSVSAQCPVCTNGPTPVMNPEVPLSIEGVPVDSCGALESTARFFQPNTPLCEGVQAIGPLCGCLVPLNACSLCPDGSIIPANSSSIELPQYPATSFIPIAPPNVPLTCETLQAVLLSTYDENLPQCHQIQLDVAETCGCPAPLMPNNSTTNDTVTDFSLTPSVSPAPTMELCTVCRDGSVITRPDKELSLGDSLPIESCQDLDSFAALFPASSEECSSVQALGGLCGCPVPEGACTLCPNGEPPSNPSRKLNWFSTFASAVPEAYQSVADSLTCEIMGAIVASDAIGVFGQEDALLCTASQLQSWICGCEPDWRAIILTWSYRISAIFSFLVSAQVRATRRQLNYQDTQSACMQGSSFIILDVVLRQENRFTTYSQLLMGMSIFDCIGSVAYMLVGVMAPVEAGFYLSRGNDTTCKIQGFLIQLGQASIFYNLFLTVYFLLVIAFNWKEHAFRPFIAWIHALVVAIGLGMAVGALPFVGPQLGICYVQQPPSTASYWPKTMFFTVPMASVLAVVTACTIAICISVSRQQRKAMRWAMRQKGLLVSRKVFWQSFWYVMAFYTTLPFLLLSYYVEFRDENYIWVFVVTAMLAPLQGFMNFLVYMIRTRFGIFRRLCCGQKKERKSSALNSTSDTSFRRHHYRRRSSLSLESNPQRSQPSLASNSPLEESAGPTMNDPAKEKLEETLRDLEDSYKNIDRLASIQTCRTDSLNSTPTPKNRLWPWRFRKSPNDDDEGGDVHDGQPPVRSLGSRSASLTYFSAVNEHWKLNR